MQLQGCSLLTTDQISSELASFLFAKADQFASRSVPTHQPWIEHSTRPPLIAHLFFEPSTRTKTSFQMAGLRLGCQILEVGVGSVSSLSKGETVSDMFRNIQAMQPDLLIVRCGDDSELQELLRQSPIPVISGGSGTQSHPTQALLDAYTIRAERGAIQGERVLICGDIAHSRVARSNADLLSRLGAEIAFCAPSYFMPEKGDLAHRRFATIEDGIAWATVIMALRVQSERHIHKPQEYAPETYRKDFGITADRLNHFMIEGIILHPGPVNWDVELASTVARDPRWRALQQVKNGVYVRAALITGILGLGDT